MFNKKYIFFILLIFIFSCENIFIEVSPPEKIKGYVYTYLGDRFSIKNSRVTVHEINKLDYLNESKIYREANIKEDSTFIIPLPRHEVPSTRLILRVISPVTGGLTLYGFAASNEVEVSIFSTVVYELITKHSSVFIMDFSYQDLNALIELAKVVFYEKVDNYHIQLKYSVPKIYKALQNAVANSSVFMNKFNSLTKRNIFAEYPFAWEAHNSVPYINSVSPMLGAGHVLSMTETQSKTFDVTAFDLEGLDLFYVWYLNGSLVEQSDNFNFYYNFITNHDSSGLHNIKVEVSDGGLLSSFSWNIRVNNLNRAPRVVSTCFDTASLVEDISYTCLVETVEDDFDYPIVFEGYYFNKNTNLVEEASDYNLSNRLPLCVGEERTGEQRNCISIVNDRSAFFTFTPTNCQTGTYNFNIRLLDSYWDKYANPQKYDRSLTNYTVSFTVQDINIAPEFLSFVNIDDFNIIEHDISNLNQLTFETTETYEFIKVIKVRDLDTLSNIEHPNGTLDDDCMDNISLSFLERPIAMIMTNLYVENDYNKDYLGLFKLRWRPRSDQINDIIGHRIRLRLSDSRGGNVNYTFYVKVAEATGKGPILMARMPITFDGTYECSNFFDPDKIYGELDACIPKYIMEEHIKLRWANISEITLRTPTPIDGNKYIRNVKMPVLNRNDYTTALTLHEVSDCPGTGVDNFNLSKIRFYIYHPSSNKKIYYTVQIIEPDPLPFGFEGLSNDPLFNNKFLILKGWGGSLNEDGDPDPNQQGLPQTVHFLPNEIGGGFSYAYGEFSWCINDIDTPINDLKVKIKACDDSNVCDTLEMKFNLPERNQAPVFSNANYNKQVQVNYMDNLCCDINGANCITIDCETNPVCNNCYDTYGVLKTCCQNQGLDAFIVAVTDPDNDIVKCSFDNLMLANDLGLLIDENTCEISSENYRPRWTNLETNSIYNVILKAIDEPIEPISPPGALVSSRSFNINLKDVNYPPYITSTPELNAYDGLEYIYNITAFDPNLNLDYKTIKYSLEAGLNSVPSNMSISSTCSAPPNIICTGLLSWTPTDAQAKQYDILNIKLKATDCNGSCNGEEKFYVQDLNINVNDINQAPKLFSSKIDYYFLADGSTYNYIISGLDPDYDDNITIETLNLGALEPYIVGTSSSGKNSVNLFVSITPNQSLVRDQPYEVNYKVYDDATESSLNIYIYIIDKNKILSIPPKQARVDTTYYYEVKNTKTSNLTYQIVTCDIPCSFNNNIFSFTPSSIDFNTFKNFKIKVIDGEFFSEQEWQVFIKLSNTSPSLTFNQTCSNSFIEDDVYILNINVSDDNINDKLLTSIYINDVWILDKEIQVYPVNFDFSNYFNSSSYGANSIKVVLTDGITKVEELCNIDIKNTYPVFDENIKLELQNANFGWSLFNEKINNFIINVYEAISKKISLLDLDLNLSHKNCNLLDFNPERIVLDNSSTSNNYFVYFAKYGHPDAASNVYLRYRAQNNTCNISNYREEVFSNNAFKYQGGVKYADVDVSGLIKRYYIDKDDRTKIKIYNEVTSITLVEEISNTYVLEDKKLIIAITPDNENISIIDPSDNLVIANIDLTSVNDPDLVDPFMATYFDEKLFVYSSNGVLSIIFLEGVDFNNPPEAYFMVHFDSFPTNNIINDEHNMIYYNSFDNLLYLLTPSSRSFTIWDLAYSYKYNTLSWDIDKNYVYFLSKDEDRSLFLADKDNGSIIKIK